MLHRIRGPFSQFIPKQHFVTPSKQCQSCPFRRLHIVQNVHKVVFTQPSVPYLLKHSIKASVICKTHLSKKASTSELSLRNPVLYDYLEQLLLSLDRNPDQSGKPSASAENQALKKQAIHLSGALEGFRTYREKWKHIQELDDTVKELGKTDKELVKMAQTEKAECQKEMDKLEAEILTRLIPPEPLDESDVIIELESGAGGQEAMLFALEILRMYERFAQYKGWTFHIMEQDNSDLGGLRKACIQIQGVGVYKHLKYEGGVHRVQRVPKTEKAGRIHTSTMSVIVMPKLTEVQVELSPKDVKVDKFCAGGPGGQHVNKTESAVRVTHLATGLSVECSSQRSQMQNYDIAMDLLRAKIYQKEYEQRIASQQNQRKLQVCSLDRSEKIRTYNYQQDRITDHRLGATFHGMDRFLDGSELLSEMVDIAQDFARKEEMLELITSHAIKMKTTKR